MTWLVRRLTLLQRSLYTDALPGLVMVQVISSLGRNPAISPSLIIRPVFVSLAFAISVPMFARFIALPLRKSFSNRDFVGKTRLIWRLTTPQQLACIVHTVILMGLVVGASYAGTSNLFAAYLAGASISWWNALDKPGHVEEPQATSPPIQRAFSDVSSQPKIRTSRSKQRAAARAISDNQQVPHCCDVSGKIIYEHYLSPVMERVLKPCFFVSLPQILLIATQILFCND